MRGPASGSGKDPTTASGRGWLPRVTAVNPIDLHGFLHPFMLVNSCVKMLGYPYSKDANYILSVLLLITWLFKYYFCFATWIPS
jgi:hypothetical protein